MPASFSHGVASFDPTADSVLLWTRHRPGARLTWRVGTDADLDHAVVSGEVIVPDDSDGCVTVDVGDLQPSTTYFYDFTTDEPGGATSMVGRTRTLPDGAVDRFRLGVTCCADDSAAPLGVYRALADREVDLVIHLGDYIYEAPTDRRKHSRELEGAAVTVDDYRQRYATMRGDPDVRHLHARHPMTTIWDDHDFADNAWRTGAKAHDPENHGPWEERARAAVRARREWLPIRPRSSATTDSIWRAITVGDLAEIVLLDTRFEGRDRQAGDVGTRSRHDPERSLLGAAQRRWMQERLRDTTRPWALVASGVVVNEMALPIPGGTHLPAGLLPNGYAVMDDQLLHDDQWDGYVAERAHLVEAAAGRAADGGRTVVLSGDVHSSWAIEGPSLDGTAVAVEAVCPAVSSAAMGRANIAGVNRILDRAARRMDHVRWANVTERGYAVVDVTPARVQLEWWAADPYADDPAATAGCARALQLPATGEPGRLIEADGPTDDPRRRGLPVATPRPDGLRAARLRRFARIWTKSSLTVGVLVGAAAALHRIGARR